MNKMTIKEYAKHADISEYKLRMMIARGDIPSRKENGKVIIDSVIADFAIMINNNTLPKLPVHEDWLERTKGGKE